MVRLPAFDIYAELGIPSSAGRAEIRAAYRRAAKAAHPDVSGPADVGYATARMARINAARDVLLDPARRAEYDRQHGLLRPRPGDFEGTVRPPSRRRRPPPGGTDSEPAPGPRGRRGPPKGECPVCPWPDPAPFGHCALGHAAMAPRFGGTRRFHLDPAEHGGGEPFATAATAREHARTCAWFAGTRAGGQRPVVLTGWDGQADFPAVGRIRQRDGVTLDPALIGLLADYADEAAVRDALAYAVAGRVVLLARYGDHVRSLVCGRHAYAVEVVLGPPPARTPARATCSCPSWRRYCKHILSTWLVWHFVGPATGLD